MNLPLLLLGLYSGILVLALSLASWLGHVLPPPEAVRRVTDAGERAALLHLLAPAKLSLIALLGLACVSGVSGAMGNGPVFALVSAALFAPILVLASLYYSSRKLLRASAQVVTGSGADQQLSICSRNLLVAVLCSEATVSLVLLGTYAIVSATVDAPQASRVVLVAASGIGLCSVIFARSSAGAMRASHQEGQLQGPHPGSLALLVAHGFHAPVLRLLTLVTLSALGHGILLLFVDGSGGDQKLWLYPHLLRVIGLMALCFGNLVVRTTESELPQTGWTRGAAVSLLLLIAGAWSLSADLPTQWARQVAAGLTFFFLIPSVFVWASSSVSHRVGGRASELLPYIPAALCFAGLLCTLTFSVNLLPADLSLPNQTLLRLFVAAALSLTPMSVVWLMARDMSESYRHVSELSYLGGGRLTVAGPSGGFTNLFPALTFTAAASALGNTILVPSGSGSLGLIQTLGWVMGALVLWALLGMSEQTCIGPMRAISQLLASHQRKSTPPSTLNLELAVESSRDATRGGLRWVLVALGPTLVVLALSFIVPAPELRSLALGMALGSAFLGVGLDWTPGESTPTERRVTGALSHVTCMGQALWLIALGMHLT